ncbi:unnamed protein product [Microthlaspi erraticum]|uniref:Uncharacterized protein n=1 Tax=Microthlaspi erraticum TaxID=1685480 RepID=A0A6D2KKG2_9BRAS|nr:unnamed protein product [Microthlaspi erraticum]
MLSTSTSSSPHHQKPTSEGSSSAMPQGKNHFSNPAGSFTLSSGVCVTTNPRTPDHQRYDKRWRLKESFTLAVQEGWNHVEEEQETNLVSKIRSLWSILEHLGREEQGRALHGPPLDRTAQDYQRWRLYAQLDPTARPTGRARPILPKFTLA